MPRYLLRMNVECTKVVEAADVEEALRNGNTIQYDEWDGFAEGPLEVEVMPSYTAEEKEFMQWVDPLCPTGECHGYCRPEAHGIAG